VVDPPSTDGLVAGQDGASGMRRLLGSRAAPKGDRRRDRGLVASPTSSGSNTHRCRFRPSGDRACCSPTHLDRNAGMATAVVKRAAEKAPFCTIRRGGALRRPCGAAERILCLGGARFFRHAARSALRPIVTRLWRPRRASAPVRTDGGPPSAGSGEGPGGQPKKTPRRPRHRDDRTCRVARAPTMPCAR